MCYQIILYICIHLHSFFDLKIYLFKNIYECENVCTVHTSKWYKITEPIKSPFAIYCCHICSIKLILFIGEKTGNLMKKRKIFTGNLTTVVIQIIDFRGKNEPFN